MSAAIIGLVGVVVGALVTGVSNYLIQNSQSKQEAAAAVRAAARLTYDDFLHRQSTLVRALARQDQGWWTESEVLAPQTTLEDRKRLLGALGDEPSQDVAGAQGWMDYLLSRRKHNDRPTGTDVDVMRDTFCRLDRARGHLSGPISGRVYTSFKDGAVLDSITPPTTLEELGVGEDCCRRRQAANYGRQSADTAATSPLILHDPLDDLFSSIR
jgi:DNA-directed RNA polymerase subunit N (RpoN/RPB10)